MIGTDVAVRYFDLSPPLRRYFVALFSITIDCPDGRILTDILHPEWGGLRYVQGNPPQLQVGPDGVPSNGPFIANGPTSRAPRIAAGNSRIWLLSMLPAGWGRFVDAPADEYADRLVDGHTDAAFSAFAQLPGIIDGNEGEEEEEIARRIDAFLLSLLQFDVPNEAQIFACQDALQDPNIATAKQLGERIGVASRSLERLCRRYFGFPPKLLLRRQRFLSSVAQFTNDPSVNWVRALDPRYHDQAQFVREFREFIGLTPHKYAAMPHPIIEPVIRNFGSSWFGSQLALILPDMMHGGLKPTREVQERLGLGLRRPGR